MRADAFLQDEPTLDAVGFFVGLETAAKWHEARARECRAIAAVNKDNSLGPDCFAHAIDHDIAAEEIRAIPAPILAGGLKGWTCSARKQALPEPAECNWPHCGCDPHATKVIDALDESGWFDKTPETLSQSLERVIKAVRYDGADADSLTVGEIRRAL